MPQFTTRIELHEASGEDYKLLHSAMERRGFSRTIKSDKGATYILPTAEYDRNGDDLTLDQVLNDAKEAADCVAITSSVLVTESLRRKWSGLSRANRSAPINPP